MPRVAHWESNSGSRAPRIRARRKPKTRTHYFRVLTTPRTKSSPSGSSAARAVPGAGLFVGRLTPNGAIRSADADLSHSMSWRRPTPRREIGLRSIPPMPGRAVLAQRAVPNGPRRDRHVQARAATAACLRRSPRRPSRATPGTRAQECFPPALRDRFDRRGHQTPSGPNRLRPTSP